MASLISALSLLILVLANGCFTLPVVDDLTTEHRFTLGLVPDDDTTVVPHLMPKRSSNDYMGFEMPSSADSQLEEKLSRVLRIFDEHFGSESFKFTTETSRTDKHDDDDLLYTTVEPISTVHEFKSRSVQVESENGTKTEPESDKRKMQVELTTNYMPSFVSSSSSSSVVVPEVYTSESSTSTSTSTEKYTGLLTDEQKYGEEVEQPPKTPGKTLRRKPIQPPVTETRPSEDRSVDRSQVDSREPFVPTAVFYQDVLTKVSNYPSGLMSLDETNDVVTGRPVGFSSTTMENKKEQKPLKQGEESPLTEEAKPDH